MFMAFLYLSDIFTCTPIITHYYFLVAHSSWSLHHLICTGRLLPATAFTRASPQYNHDRGLIKPARGSVLQDLPAIFDSVCFVQYQAAMFYCTSKALVNCMQMRMTWVYDVKQDILLITGWTRGSECSVSLGWGRRQWIDSARSWHLVEATRNTSACPGTPSCRSSRSTRVWKVNPAIPPLIVHSSAWVPKTLPPPPPHP